MRLPAAGRSGGIALVLTVGILVMLSVAAAAMVAFAGRLRLQGGLQLDRIQARLLARSGVDYASARFSRDPASLTLAREQSDDWAFRDPRGTPLEQATNPSYARGEPYTDLADNGRHDLGYDPYRDLDFNGRFDSWSGRLRGARGRTGQLFLLRVDSGDGAVPVNPDPADPAGRLADFLDTLGSACGASPGIGRRIIENRPKGGYASLAHLHYVLGFDRERMAPLLRLDPVDAGDYFGSTLERGYSWGIGAIASGKPVRRGHVDLNTARPELLQAMLEGLGPALPECPALTAGEARALARAIAARRPFDAWPRFAAWLYEEGKAHVDNGPIVLSNASRYYVNEPAAVPRWEVLFPIVDSNLNPDNMDTTSISAPYIGLEPFALEGSFGPRSWWTYDRTVPVRRRKEEWVSRKRPDAAAPAADTPYGTQEGSLEAAPAGLLIESAGIVRAGAASCPAAVARASGEARPQRRIRASSQRDFENFPEFVRLNDEVTVAGRPKRDRMQTYPLFSLDSSRDVLGKHWDTDVGAINTGATQYVDYGVDYPFASGSLRLMDRSPGPRPGDTMYVPCWEEGQPMRDPPESAGLSDNLRDFPSQAYRPFMPWAFFPGGLTKSYYDSNVRPHPLVNGAVIDEGTIQLVTWLGGFNRSVSPSTNQTHFISIWGVGLLSQYIRFHLCNRYGANDVGVQINGESAIKYQVSPLTVGEWTDSNRNQLKGLRAVEPNDFHQLAFAFSALGIQGYIDGLPDPGLHEAAFLPMAAPPNNGGTWMGFAWMDEGRISRPAETQAGILARSQESRFWTPDPLSPDPRFEPVPSFLSPVYRLAGPRTFTGARWDGYVPARIRDAVEEQRRSGGNPSAPLRVELHCWRNPDAEGDPDQIVKLREDLWKTGGGWHPFEVPGVRAFRYKVYMDASAVDAGYNNETPVFDSISVTYRGRGPRLSGMTVD